MSEPLVGIPIYLIVSLFFAYHSYQGAKRQEIKAKNLILRPNRNVGLYYVYTWMNLCFVYFCLFNAADLLAKVLGKLVGFLILGLLFSAPPVFIFFTKWATRKPEFERLIEEVPPALPQSDVLENCFTIDQDAQSVLTFKMTSKKEVCASKAVEDVFDVFTIHQSRFAAFLSAKKSALLVELADISRPGKLTIQLSQTRLTVRAERKFTTTEKENFKRLANLLRQALEEHLFGTRDEGLLALRRGTLRMWVHQLKVHNEEKNTLYECVVYLRENDFQGFTATLTAGTEHQSIERQFGSLSETKTADETFNDHFYFHTEKPNELIKLLGPTARGLLRELLDLGETNHLVVQINGYRLQIVKKIPANDNEALNALKHKSLHLALAMLHPEKETLIKLEESEFEIVEIKQSQDGDETSFCQVCGQSLDENIIRCTKCHTAHHFDCWHYVGNCSTYGCGSKGYSL